jgi:hypothetical protein
MAAIFYEAPPIRWSYRGLGELVIALSYGPWMVLGSLYLHTRALSWGAFAASLVPGLLIMSLAVVNAIPDYHQDLLVGKRNLVVRLGRAGGVTLYLSLAAAALAVAAAGALAGLFPAGCLATLLALPLLVASARRARGTYTKPREFVPAIRSIVACYAAAVTAVHARRAPAPVVTMHRIDSFGAPLFVSWQLTRDCDLACVHCCTDSAPGKRLPDELGADEAMLLAEDIARSGVPYVMLCGGEPLVVPHFFAVAEALGRAGVQLKIETNGQQFDASVATRLARLPIRSIQVSLDGDTQEVYGRQRAGGSLAKAHAACRAIRDAGPASGDHVRAHARQSSRGRGGHRPRPRIGAFRFNSGKLMRLGTGRAALEQGRTERGAVSRIPAVLARAARVLEPPSNCATFPGASRTGFAPLCWNRRPRCWCFQTAGSRWRRRFRAFAPISVASPSSRPGRRTARPGGTRQRELRCDARSTTSRHTRRQTSGSGRQWSTCRFVERNQHERFDCDRRHQGRSARGSAEKTRRQAGVGNPQARGRLGTGDGPAVHPLHLIFAVRNAGALVRRIRSAPVPCLAVDQQVQRPLHHLLRRVGAGQGVGR